MKEHLTKDQSIPQPCGHCGLPHEGLSGYNHQFVGIGQPSSNDETTWWLRDAAKILYSNGTRDHADAVRRGADELDRQRAEIERLRTLLRIARDEWYDDNGQWGDGFGLKHWTRKADALLSGDSSFHELEKRHE